MIGNIRVTFSDDNGNGLLVGDEIRSRNDYYTFGMEMNSRWKLAETYPLLSQYKFNGSEFVKDMNLNQGIFFARNYDPVLGRWWVPDPLSHFAPDWTPYRFGFNNPLIYTDPFGLFESKEEARKYAKAQGIKTGFLRDNKIVENNDGTWSIENKKEHSSISNLGGDLGIVKGSMVAANDVMDSKITGSGNLISLQLNVIKHYRDGSTNQSELFNSLSVGTTSGGNVIVIGEGMSNVKHAAKLLKQKGINAKWYQAWSKNFPDYRLMTPNELKMAINRNYRWIRSKIKQGYKIYDIGIDPTKATRSPFYEVEKNTIDKLKYPTSKLPE